MGDMRRIAKSGQEETAVVVLKDEVRVPEATRWEWRCPQTVVPPTLEEAERWDGLS